MPPQRSPFAKLLLLLLLLLAAGCVAHNVVPPVALRDAATREAAGHYSVIYEFKGCPDGAYPAAKLVALHGLLYGTTQYGGAPGSCGNFGNGTVFSITPSGHEKVLYRFTGSPDGSLPSGSLAALGGKLYGVTSNGGAYNAGAVFEVTPSGKERVLYSFQGGSDGSSPAGSLAVKNGRLFGTTMLGGGNGCHGAGCGVVFSLSPSGSLKIVYRFRGGRDGFAPTGLSNINGNFYGATPNGGSLCRVGDYTSTCGTIFKVDSDGNKTTLYTFKGRADGANPNGDLIGKDGLVYGTSVHGGALDGLCTEYGYGCGVVLSLTNDKEHVLHRFKAPPDGAWPDAGLVSYGTGFIGTASGGGGCSYMRLGCGALFSISASGAERVLHDFKGAPSSDGSSPGPLTTLGTRVFGVTALGGSARCGQSNVGCGAVFMFVP